MNREMLIKVLTVGLVVVAVTVVAVAVFLNYQKNQIVSESVFGGDVRKSDVFIEQQNMAYFQAMQQSDSSVLRTLPKASTLKAETTDEVARLFDLSRLASSFGAVGESASYLLKIVDSDSPSAEPFKSAAAFFLLNDSYDDAQVLVTSVNSSPFMRQLTSVASTVFPKDVALTSESLTLGQRSRFMTSYLVALSEREDAFAARARAASIVGGYYIILTKTPSTDPVTLEKFRVLSHTLLGRAVASVKRTVLNPTKIEGLSAYDTVAGLDNLSDSIDSIRLLKLEKEFSEVAGIDPAVLLKMATAITASDAPALDAYTTYLYATHLAKFSKDTKENNNDEIDTLVKRLVGNPPFASVNQSSWAMKRLVGSQSADLSNVYRRENIAAIARRSPTLREFLTLKDGWTETDFTLRDSF